VHYPYNLSKKLIVLLYIPWIISEMISYHPVLSYFVAWVGSFFIFYLTIVSPLSQFSVDLPKKQQAMRPIVLIQLIFAGFMCCTSIFYFFDHLGYEYLTDINVQSFHASEQTERIAKCQRLSLLAHIALSTGILSMTKCCPPVKYGVAAAQIPLLIKICILTYLAASSLNLIPELIQFKQPLLNIALSCSGYLFILGTAGKHRFYMLFGMTAFGLNIITAILSGFKEAVILNVILIAFLTYPYFKRTVLVLAVPCISILLYVLPTFTTVIRNQSWIQKKTREQAGVKAYQTFFDEHNEHEILISNWEFLTNRFSEIGMFTVYVKQVPAQYPYYGLKIIENSIIALVPRALWREKPNTEHLAMERVYDAGVVNRASSVSAKTRPVIDAYLTAGPIGVFIAMLIYGMLTQLICNKAEQLFGGYELGCAIIFNSLFQSLWRGNTFEFLLNNIIYSYILMMIIHWILKKTNTLTPI
jgi:hypothetical protein